MGPGALNATIVFTWGVMAVLAVTSWLITRRLADGPSISRWQNLLEVVVSSVEDQIHEVSHQDARPYLPFVGTLFLFIAACNLLTGRPWRAPTACRSSARRRPSWTARPSRARCSRA